MTGDRGKLVVKATAVTVCAVLLALWPAGCAGPSRANIELRKQNAALRDKIDTMHRAHEADLAQIAALESRVGGGTLPTLPATRMAELVTTHGLSLGRLTGGYGSEPDSPGDKGLMVYATPTDGAGDDLKAAGSFVIEAFDLSRPDDRLIGRWTFDQTQSLQNWNSHGMLYTYVLQCPWQQVVPRTDELTVRVTFLDALTQRQFTEQKVVRIVPPAVPPTTAPVTTPAAANP